MKYDAENSVLRLQKNLRIEFTDAGLLEEAITHKSYSIERGAGKFNERLEFLGDSVLSAVVAAYLFKKYPGCDEGEMSKMKAHSVSRKNLFVWAAGFRLQDFIRMSKAEEHSGGRQKESILANTMEAIIGAVFLDRGYTAAQDFICGMMDRYGTKTTDSKSELQEMIQAEYGSLPVYKVVSENGPDHDKVFRVSVGIGKKLLGAGTGKSKKEAEQSAAGDGLRKLGRERK